MFISSAGSEDDQEHDCVLMPNLVKYEEALEFAFEPPLPGEDDFY